MSSRGAVNEVIQSRLYQRGRFMSWPRKKKDEVLDERGITLVVNLWSKVDPEVTNDTYRTYLHFPISSNNPPVEAIMDVLVQFIIEFMRQGGAVLLHCEAGVNRSCFLAACIVAEYHDASGEFALNEVERLCGRTKINPKLRQYVLERYP